MAYATLAAPGTETGPCVEPCNHTDCAATRQQAAALCGLCNQPISYDTPFYADPNHPTTGWVHRTCLLASPTLLGPRPS